MDNCAFFFCMPTFLLFFFKTLVYREVSLQLCLLEFFFDQKYNFIFFLFFFYLFMLFFAQQLVSNFFLFFLFFLNLSITALFYKAAGAEASSLWNGLNMVHPVFVFFSYCSYILGIKIYYSFFLTKFFIFFNKIFYFFFYFTTCALVLGAWWAQEELNWGGWWSWDLVECGLLFFFFISLQCIHGGSLKKISYVFFFLFFFLGIRYEFFNSVHAFISSSFTPSFIFFFLLLVLVLALGNFFKFKNYIKECAGVVVNVVICFFNTALCLSIIFAWFQCFFFSLSPYFFFFQLKKKKFLHFFIFSFFFFSFFLKKNFSFAFFFFEGFEYAYEFTSLSFIKYTLFNCNMYLLDTYWQVLAGLDNFFSFRVNCAGFSKANPEGVRFQSLLFFNWTFVLVLQEVTLATFLSSFSLSLYFIINKAARY